MAIQESLRSARSFYEKHKKGIVATGTALLITATACTDIFDRGTNTASTFGPQDTGNTISYNKVATSIPGSTSSSTAQADCKNPLVGIRNDHPEIMEDIKELCLGSVRIAVDPHTYHKSPKAARAIERANQLGYSVLCTIVTHRFSKDEAELAKEVADKCRSVEIGNEVDNDDIPFWEKSEDYKRLKKEGADLNTLHEVIIDEYTDDFVEIFKAIKEKNPDARIIVGANVDVGITVRIFEILMKKGVPVNDLYAAVHIYNSGEDALTRLEFMNRHFNLEKIVATEVGARNDDKRELVKVMKAIRSARNIRERDPEKKRNKIEMFIHELSNEQGYGCRDVFMPKLDFGKCQPIRQFAMDDEAEQQKYGYTQTNIRPISRPRRLTQRRFDHRRAA